MTAECPTIGAIVLNWNAWEDTLACVRHLRAATYPDVKLYVVDNASEDGSVAKLRAHDPTLQVIESGGNLGWAGGNNIGIRCARADGCTHVWLVNPDVRVRPESLAYLVEEAAREDAAAVGSVVLSELDPEWVEFGGTITDPQTQFPKQISCPRAELEPLPAVAPTLAVKGCSMLITEAGLDRVGLLNEAYFLNYEETDWCYRARSHGMACYLASRAVVYHRGAASFGGVEGPLYRYFILRNRILFARNCLDSRGRRAAWRGVVWELERALPFLSEGSALSWRQRWMLVRTVSLAVENVVRGRFGDCPSAVREMNRAFTLQKV